MWPFKASATPERFSALPDSLVIKWGSLGIDQTGSDVDWEGEEGVG